MSAGQRPQKQKQVRAADRIYFAFDSLIKSTIKVIDDVYVPIVSASTVFFLSSLNAVLSLLVKMIWPAEKLNLLSRFLARIAAIVLALPLLLGVFVVTICLLVLGAALASILGFRNLGQYSALEQLIAWAPIVVALAAIPYFCSEFTLFRVSSVLACALIMTGLSFVYGLCGILTLSHAAFVMLGSYGTVWLYNSSFGMHLPIYLAVVISAFLTGVTSLLLGLPSLRVRDHYLLVVTLAFTLAVPKALKSNYLAAASGFKMGGLTLDQIAFPSLLAGVPAHVGKFYLVLLPALLLLFIAYNLHHHSQIGRAFLAIKCDQEVAGILGISIVRYKLLAFFISAFYAAFGGGLLVVLIPFIGPDSYSVHDSVEYLVGAVVGGTGSILGSVLGGGYVVMEQSYSKLLTEQFPRGQNLLPVARGVLLIGFVYFAPRGVASFAGNLFAILRRRGIRRWQHLLSPPPDYRLSSRKRRSDAARPASQDTT